MKKLGGLNEDYFVVGGSGNRVHVGSTYIWDRTHVSVEIGGGSHVFARSLDRVVRSSVFDVIKVIFVVIRDCTAFQGCKVMLFCESCREKKNWTRSAGYPYIGFRLSEKCEVCGKIGECHDLPAIRLVPKNEMTFEQKMVDKIMQEGYRDKANSLVVTRGNGEEWYTMTEEIRNAFARRNGEIDWYDTYELRVALREQIQNAEARKKNV